MTAGVASDASLPCDQVVAAGLEKLGATGKGFL